MNSLAASISPGKCLPRPLRQAKPNSAEPVIRSVREVPPSAGKSPAQSTHAGPPQLPPFLRAHGSDPTAAYSRREAIGFGMGVGLFDFVLSGWLWQSEAAEQRPCELKVAPSGLAYCDKVVGYGAEAAKGQLIKAHYVGKLENGKVFDSSYNRGKPLTFRVGVGEVIKGWDEGILGGEGVPPMLAGGKRILKLPPELGYGMRGAGCRGGSCIIPPNSVLLFDVEYIGKA
ncbi:peptidyl-prolyl cis-trans isomerase FKBP13, chloroplastic-like [Punica granatum]|uniref:Peptidyl-prolyl cis-trans isomerase FKBP13, chloroplastic-like n=2 Tax=Punica granatum TaxID=22663 RepID=A0A6P8D887_PUNGR|nr:peptidyl-prolyl cis-trans isomerase FKBP13, chloroplastic-like [Punica granatum]PKI58749.1 hypothetical protein CRG98_020856 [Punica granatum]